MSTKNTDEIHVRGIRSKGFGQLPKIVMLDPNIPLAAKGIYAHFVSYTGGGNNKAFPAVDTILHNLGVSSNTYYKYYNILLDLGLITVEQHNGGAAGKGFKKNIYTIEYYPGDYINALNPLSLKNMLNKVVSARDLSGAGYGNIPKLVMTDTRLSLEAKAMYAYICVYSGISYSATPDKKTAMYHLNISSNSYAKYGAELEGIGYITRKRMYKDGKFDGVHFLLSKEITDNGPAAPDTKISDTVASPRTKISDTINVPHTKFSDTLDSHTKFSDTINSQTNNPSPISGTVVNTTCVYQSISRAYTHETVTDDREIDVTHHEVLQEIVAYGSLPYAYCFHREQLETAVEVLTDFELELATENAAGRQLYKLFVSALVDMLDANTADTVIKGAKLSYAKIFEALVPAIEVGYTELDEPYAVAFELYAGVKRRYEAARAQTPIKRPISYMKAVIWTELTTAEVEIQDQFAYDFGGKT